MLTGRPKTALELSAEEEAELRAFSSSRSLPHALVARAKLVLWSAEGKTNTEIASQLKWTKATGTVLHRLEVVRPTLNDVFLGATRGDE